jgi:hypothetical protein
MGPEGNEEIRKIGGLSVPVTQDGWLHRNLYLEGRSLFPPICRYIFTIEGLQTAYAAEVCVAWRAQFPLL